MAYGEKPKNCPDHVDAIETYGGCWPDDVAFPFTPEEAYWILRGFSVKPKSLDDPAVEALTGRAVLDLLPGKIERHDGHFVLWRA